MTIFERFKNPRKLKVAISWAYATSHAKPLSVPQSQILMFARYGMDVTVAAPKEFPLMPDIVETAYSNAELNGGSLKFVDNMEEILLEVAEGNTNGKPVRNGNLIRGSGSEVYWLVNGEKHLVESDAALQSLGFGLEDIQSVKDEVLTQIPGGNTGGLL
jgi:hypothetical protein